jgi:hypothetical protein
MNEAMPIWYEVEGYYPPRGIWSSYNVRHATISEAEASRAYAEAHGMRARVVRFTREVIEDPRA